MKKKNIFFVTTGLFFSSLIALNLSLNINFDQTLKTFSLEESTALASDENNDGRDLYLVENYTLCYNTGSWVGHTCVNYTCDWFSGKDGDCYTASQNWSCDKVCK